MTGKEEEETFLASSFVSVFLTLLLNLARPVTIPKALNPNKMIWIFLTFLRVTGVMLIVGL